MICCKIMCGCYNQAWHSTIQDVSDQLLLIGTVAWDFWLCSMINDLSECIDKVVAIALYDDYGDCCVSDLC